MTINEDTVKGKWREIKGEVQKAWGKLTADEIEQTKGDTKAIAGLVQQKYGKADDKFQQKFEKIMEPYKDKKESSIKNVKEKLKHNK